MPGLTLHTSNRLEILADRLADMLDAAPADPFQAEVILVQSRGMERWVSLELAKRHGVAANLRFPFPNHFVQKVFRAVLGGAPGKAPGRGGSGVPTGHRDDDAPFDPAVLTWEIMGLLPSLLDRPGFEALRGYLGEAERDLRGASPTSWTSTSFSGPTGSSTGRGGRRTTGRPPSGGSW